jgi:Mrp family chromosome partitioning ATPase
MADRPGADRPADRSRAPDPSLIAAAIARASIGLSTGVPAADDRAAGQGERRGVAIGVAGVGKSTILAPLVDAWREDGRRVYGMDLAWRQTDDLTQAGIAEAIGRRRCSWSAPRTAASRS